MLQLLKGDAPQRALQVAAMERKMAQETSGTDWMVPFLMVGMLDKHEDGKFDTEQITNRLQNRNARVFDI